MVLLGRCLSQMSERLHMMQHETNQGGGGAIATGYKWAALLPFIWEWCCDHEVKGEVDYAK